MAILKKKKKTTAKTKVSDKFGAQKDYASRMRAAGFERYSTWIPSSCREEASEFTAGLRDKERTKAKAEKAG